MHPVSPSRSASTISATGKPPVPTFGLQPATSTYRARLARTSVATVPHARLSESAGSSKRGPLRPSSARAVLSDGRNSTDTTDDRTSGLNSRLSSGTGAVGLKRPATATSTSSSSTRRTGAPSTARGTVGGTGTPGCVGSSSRQQRPHSARAVSHTASDGSTFSHLVANPELTQGWTPSWRKGGATTTLGSARRGSDSGRFQEAGVGGERGRSSRSKLLYDIAMYARKRSHDDDTGTNDEAPIRHSTTHPTVSSSRAINGATSASWRTTANGTCEAHDARHVPRPPAPRHDDDLPPGAPSKATPVTGAQSKHGAAHGGLFSPGVEPIASEPLRCHETISGHQAFSTAGFRGEEERGHERSASGSSVGTDELYNGPAEDSSDTPWTSPTDSAPPPTSSAGVPLGIPKVSSIPATPTRCDSARHSRAPCCNSGTYDEAETGTCNGPKSSASAAASPAALAVLKEMQHRQTFGPTAFGVALQLCVEHGVHPSIAAAVVEPSTSAVAMLPAPSPLSSTSRTNWMAGHESLATAAGVVSSQQSLTLDRPTVASLATASGPPSTVSFYVALARAQMIAGQLAKAQGTYDAIVAFKPNAVITSDSASQHSPAGTAPATPAGSSFSPRSARHRVSLHEAATGGWMHPATEADRVADSSFKNSQDASPCEPLLISFGDATSFAPAVAPQPSEQLRALTESRAVDALRRATDAFRHGFYQRSVEACDVALTAIAQSPLSSSSGSGSLGSSRGNAAASSSSSPFAGPVLAFKASVLARIPGRFRDAVAALELSHAAARSLGRFPAVLNAALGALVAPTGHGYGKAGGVRSTTPSGSSASQTPFEKLTQWRQHCPAPFLSFARAPVLLAAPLMPAAVALEAWAEASAATYAATPVTFVGGSSTTDAYSAGDTTSSSSWSIRGAEVFDRCTAGLRVSVQPVSQSPFFPHLSLVKGVREALDTHLSSGNARAAVELLELAADAHNGPAPSHPSSRQDTTNTFDRRGSNATSDRGSEGNRNTETDHRLIGGPSPVRLRALARALRADAALHGAAWALSAAPTASSSNGAALPTALMITAHDFDPSGDRGGWRPSGKRDKSSRPNSAARSYAAQRSSGGTTDGSRESAKALAVEALELWPDDALAVATSAAATTSKIDAADAVGRLRTVIEWLDVSPATNAGFGSSTRAPTTAALSPMLCRGLQQAAVEALQTASVGLASTMHGPGAGTSSSSHDAGCAASSAHRESKSRGTADSFFNGDSQQPSRGFGQNHDVFSHNYGGARSMSGSGGAAGSGGKPKHAWCRPQDFRNAPFTPRDDGLGARDSEPPMEDTARSPLHVGSHDPRAASSPSVAGASTTQRERLWGPLVAEAEALCSPSLTHYGVLGLRAPVRGARGPSSSGRDVTKAYRQLVLKWHPDKVVAAATRALSDALDACSVGHSGGTKKAQQRQDNGLTVTEKEFVAAAAQRAFLRIQEAFQCLNDEASRRAYDARL